MLQAADLFFVVFHTALILFNLFGWIWHKTRLANLISLVLTGLSWTALGIFYGLGYCPFTDWHFQILEKMGATGLPSSYIAYLIERLSGYEPDETLTDNATLILFLVSLGASVYMNFFRRSANLNNSQNQ